VPAKCAYMLLLPAGKVITDLGGAERIERMTIDGQPINDLGLAVARYQRDLTRKPDAFTKKLDVSADWLVSVARKAGEKAATKKEQRAAKRTAAGKAKEVHGRRHRPWLHNATRPFVRLYDRAKGAIAIMPEAKICATADVWMKDGRQVVNMPVVVPHRRATMLITRLNVISSAIATLPTTVSLFLPALTSLASWVAARVNQALGRDSYRDALDETAEKHARLFLLSLPPIIRMVPMAAATLAASDRLTELRKQTPDSDNG